MDDLVLLSLHKLLGSFVLNASSAVIHERAFGTFAHVLRRCKPRMRGNQPGQVQRRLSFVQSCVLYLPPPPEAGDDGEEPEELRLAILQSLRELLEDEEQEKQAIQLQVDQQHFFAYLVAALLHYLPGVAAGLWKSANAPQQASKVIVAALDCLAIALDLCIGDERLLGDEEVKQEPQRFTLEAIRQSVEKKEETDESTNLPSSESDKWLETTAINLDLLLSRMFAASATAVAAGTKVAREADTVLQKLQMSALSSEERLRVLPEMADRFQMLLSTLVLKIATEHEATKVHFVRTLRGYLAFLGSSLTPYLDAAMESIYSSLCRVVSFAVLDIELVVHQTLPSVPEGDRSNDNTAASVVVSQFQKRLRYFNEEASVQEVFAMLRDVGAVSTPAGFIDCAFMLLSEAATETGSAEVVLVLNEFLRAYCSNKEGSEESMDVHLIGRILEDLLALEAWEEHSSHRSSRALVSQRALMVECIGVCAEILGAEFKSFLLYVLYPLVEQLGSHSVEKVYFFTGYESLEALFQANMDYFVDSLCARLEQLDAYPMTAFVVEALLRHTRLASLPLVNEPDSQDDDRDKDEDASGYRTLVIDIMDRCGYFLGVRFLSQHQKQLLPLVARMWPELLPRLRVENRAIVTGTVRVITTLAETAGDFVGDRFMESVWPVLQSQMQSINFGADAKSSQLTRSMLLISKPHDEAASDFDAQTRTGNKLSALSGTRKTQEIRHLLAILSCLTMVCQQSETVTRLVPEITRVCSKYLTHAAPREVVEQTLELFAALVQLNGDEVFCTIAALADWVPAAPPSARFSRFEPDAVQRFYRVTCQVSVAKPRIAETTLAS
ncbi:Armadillo-type fold [Phytophthora cactorum]|nr:Armadillo-type fold [Phytophthora cactorum]